MAKNDKKEKEDTPLIKQYYKFKAACPEALLLMRVGDFYETYGEDAVKASKVLGIVQTRKSNGEQGYIELAGFPHHSLESYMPKLVRAGYKVAVCDQLTGKENNYIASLCFYKDKGGVAFLDVSTGAFKVAEGDLDYLDLLISDFSPKELRKGCASVSRLRPRISISRLWRAGPLSMSRLTASLSSTSRRIR